MCFVLFLSKPPFRPATSSKLDTNTEIQIDLRNMAVSENNLRKRCLCGHVPHRHCTRLEARMLLKGACPTPQGGNQKEKGENTWMVSEIELPSSRARGEVLVRMADGGRALRRLVRDHRPGRGQMLVKMCCRTPWGALEWGMQSKTILLGSQGTEQSAFPGFVCVCVRKFPQASPGKMLPSAKGNSLGKGVSESLVANTPAAGPW